MYRALLLLYLVVSMPAAGGLLEDAKAAHDRGDYQEELRLLRPLAEGGDATAQHNLAVIYRDGLGVPQNPGEAAKWYRRAAEQGDAHAQYNLASMYEDGRGVPQDNVEAVRWYRLAAAQGHAQARDNLGFMYDNGLGVPQDKDVGRMWHHLAAESTQAEPKPATTAPRGLREEARRQEDLRRANEAQKMEDARKQQEARAREEERAREAKRMAEERPRVEEATRREEERRRPQLEEAERGRQLERELRDGTAKPAIDNNSSRTGKGSGTMAVAPEVPLKTGPKALKLPYSPQALAQLDRLPEPRSAGNDLAPGTARVVARPVQDVADATISRDRIVGEKEPPESSTDAEHIEWMWPTTGKVTSAFSESSKGILVTGEPGRAVVASAAGLVTYVGSDLKGYRRMVIVKHNKTYLSVYTNNSQILVKEGQSVSRGEKIAEMGAGDGETLGLHFEIRRLGKAVDPMNYLPNESRTAKVSGMGDPGGAATIPNTPIAKAPPLPPTPPPVPTPPKGELQSAGSGFFVSPTGDVVTNAHVVADCRVIYAANAGELRVVAVDDQSDLALLHAEHKPIAFAQIAGGRGARIGESVVVIGFPFGGALTSDPTVTTGNIAALTGMGNDRRDIQITAPVQPGNSGGPLLGPNGAVLGVVVGKLNALKIAETTGDIPQNVNFAVSVGTLQSFLNAYGVAFEVNSNTTVMGSADIAAQAARSVLKIECFK